MTVTRTIPAEQLTGLDVHQGDVLRVVAVEESGVVIQIHRHEDELGQVPGKAAQWVKSAKGTVHLAPNETADDARN
jgi:predicted RNA-binding protein YlqC (UPF0109 family)